MPVASFHKDLAPVPSPEPAADPVNRGNGMSEGALGIVARRFKVLGEPMRLRILQLLKSGEQSVTQLVEVLGTTQANVSRHLSVLSAHSMVDRRRDGSFVYYFISDQVIFELCELMCSSLREDYVSKGKALG